MPEVLEPKVLNVRDVGKKLKGAIYVGRPSQWGNPYEIGKDGTREAVVEAYRDYLEMMLAEDPSFLAPLRGKDLICWCTPEPCHADILLEYANGEI